MAALAHSLPHPVAARPAGFAETGRAPAPRLRPAAAVYRRRRLAVAGAAISLVPVLHAGLGLLGGGPLTAPRGPGDVPVAARSYVVQPGDTVWSIAHRLVPHGDERPLVARISAQTGGAPLQVGQALSLP